MTSYIAGHLGVIAVAILAALVVAVIGGLMTEVGPWYESLRFPRLRPPNWLFGPAWTLIFMLTAASGVMAWDAAPDAASRRTLAILFAINGVLNAGWSPLFFKLKRPDWALIEVAPFWISIVGLVVFVAPFAPGAAELLAPYLVWVTFASWLNWRIVRLNAPFGHVALQRRG